MKETSKLVLAVKVGIVTFLFAMTLYFVLEQRDEIRMHNSKTASDYQQASGITQVIPGGIAVGIYAETRHFVCFKYSFGCLKYLFECFKL